MALHAGMALHHAKLGRGVVLEMGHNTVTIRFHDGKDRRILTDRLVYEAPRSQVPEGLAPVDGPEVEVFAQLAALEPFEVPEVREGFDEGTVPLTPTPEPLELPSGALVMVDPARVGTVASAKEWGEVFSDDSSKYVLLGSGAALATRWHDETGALVALALRVGEGEPEQWVRSADQLGDAETSKWVLADAQTLLAVDKGNGINRLYKRALRPKKQGSFAFRLGRGRIKETEEGDPTQGLCCAFRSETADAYGLDANGDLAVVLMYASPYFAAEA